MRPVACTIISPKYAKVGREAVRRFKKYTGITPEVIKAKDGWDAFQKKLSLDLLLPRGPVWFFDSDLWLLDDLDLDGICNGPCLFAAFDPAALNPAAFPHTDCQNFGMPKTEYWNSGHFGFNTLNQKHRLMFQMARRLKKRVDGGNFQSPTDKTDQFFLNYCRIKAGVPLSLMPSSWNTYLLSAFWGQQPWIPRCIIGLHGAGIVADEKYEKLMAQASVFEHPYCDLHPEVLAFEMARMFSFR